MLIRRLGAATAFSPKACQVPPSLRSSSEGTLGPFPTAQSQVTTAPAGTVLGRRSEPWAEASWWVPSLPPCSCLQVAAGEGLGGPPAVRGTLGNQVWSHRPLEAQDGASSGGLQSASLCFCTCSDVPATRTPVTHLTLRKPRSRAFAGGQAEAQGQRDRPWGPP